MQYHNITKDDMLNGEGLRVVLWVSGCSHHCEGCHNAVTWDPEGGLVFDAAAEEELFSLLSRDYISGITFSGQSGGNRTAGEEGQAGIPGEEYLAVYRLPLGGNQRTAADAIH